MFCNVFSSSFWCHKFVLNMNLNIYIFREVYTCLFWCTWPWGYRWSETFLKMFWYVSKILRHVWKHLKVLYYIHCTTSFLYLLVMFQDIHTHSLHPYKFLSNVFVFFFIFFCTVTFIMSQVSISMGSTPLVMVVCSSSSHYHDCDSYQWTEIWFQFMYTMMRNAYVCKAICVCKDKTQL